MKLTKKEWLDFNNDESDNDAWIGRYMDDVAISVDGTEIEEESKEFQDLPLSTKITVSGDIINLNTGEYIQSLDAQLRAWRKAQKYITLVVDISKDKAEELKAVIVAAGAKIIP
jgi:hypothetical protein